MAKVAGIKCDVCSTFVTLPNDAVRPDTWLRVILPHSNGDRDYERDLCSNLCMAKLGRERALEFGERKVKPSGKSNMTDDLRSFLASRGVSGRAVGGATMVHHRDKHEQTHPRPGCLVCEYITSNAAP